MKVVLFAIIAACLYRDIPLWWVNALANDNTIIYKYKCLSAHSSKYAAVEDCRYGKSLFKH